MTHRISAVYEKGVFRPVQPVELQDGARVELVHETPGAAADPRELAGALDEIASLPCEGPDDGFSGDDADRVLYGGESAA